jgi:BioD-like phosphotransacetylase family protein
MVRPEYILKLELHVAVLYVVSVEAGAGKTSVCAGLARNLMDAGKKVGYLKPNVEETGDSDLTFMKKLLQLDDATPAANGRDTVLVEAMLGGTAADVQSQTVYGAAREMQAKVIAVEAYADGAADYAAVYKGFGEALLGVLVNKVPKSRLDEVRNTAATRCNDAGVRLLGVIPESRTLLAVSVQELAERVRGTIISDADKADGLVENFMLGAMVVGSGVDYFGLMERKAAIVRQDRPDMQLAALDTPSACLVLGGSTEPPLYNVLERSRLKGIPVISTATPVSDIAETLDELLLGGRMNQEKKLPRLAELVKESLDISTLV